MQMTRIIFLVMAILTIVFSGVRQGTADSFPPLPEALDALQSDAAVTVTEVTVPEWPAGSNFYFSFEPTAPGATIGLIIYPGALVDPRSYAPAAHAIAAQGYVTVIVKMIDDLALGASVERATKIINDYPAIEKWAIGGHSMGGFGACAYTKNHTENIDGVVLWAAYPSNLARLDDKIIKAISIYGTNDGLFTPDELEESRTHLPPYTQWAPIDGGNHTQFGWYDTSPDPVQPGDNPATITRETQQNIIVQGSADFLNNFNLCPNDPNNDYDNDAVCGDVDNCPYQPNQNQEDTYPPAGNGLGDACECEGNFNCSADQDVDGSDAALFKTDFGRNSFNRKCVATDICNGDFSCDGDVDGTDAALFKLDFGRNQFNNPCPACVGGGAWCGY